MVSRLLIGGAVLSLFEPLIACLILRASVGHATHAACCTAPLTRASASHFFFLMTSGQILCGVFKCLSIGGLGVWWLVDIILLASGNLWPADGYSWEPYW